MVGGEAREIPQNGSCQVPLEMNRCLPGLQKPGGINSLALTGELEVPHWVWGVWSSGTSKGNNAEYWK